MHHGIVQRRVIRFPGAPNQTFVAAGIPGIAAAGGFVIASADVALAAQVNSAEQSSSRIAIPPTGGAVRAIGIDPESAIACCDISFAGSNGEIDRRRITPGNPAFLGCADRVDFVDVTIPWSLPIMLASVVPSGAGKVAAHDTVDILDESSGLVAPGWPLRLELWRGEILPMRTHRRAPMLAHFAAVLVGAADVRDYLVCVDGRRRVDVYVYVRTGSSVTITAFDHVGWKNGGTPSVVDEGGADANAVPLALTDAGSLSEVVSSTNPRVFSFAGNPMGILRVHVDAGGNAEVQVKIRAED